MRIAVAAVMAVSTAACSTPPRTASVEAPQVTVTLGRASTSDVPARFDAGGVVRAKLTAPIAARILAPIVDVHVRAGDRVHRGQTLVTLDGRDLRAQTERAAAALAAARQTVRAASAEKQVADAALTLATVSFDRVNGLQAKRSATRQELDEATAALDGARARVAAADAHVAESSAALDVARATADTASIAASYAVIAAPFDGTISERLLDPGAIAAPGAPMLILEDTSAFRLEVRVDEARAEQLAVGQTADIRLDGAEDLMRRSRIGELSRIDAASHAFLVKLDIPPSAGLRSGRFGRAFFSGAARATLTVPAAAIVRRGQLAFVFVVDDERIARLRPVTVGAPVGDRVEVIAGLADGETLVANPQPTLTDGVRVKAGAHQ